MLITDPAALVAYFDTRVSLVPITTAATQLWGYNPHRVGVLLQNVGTPPIIIGPEGGVLTSRGIGIRAGEQPWELHYARHGLLVCLPWYGVVATGNGSLYVIELTYMPVVQKRLILPADANVSED